MDNREAPNKDILEHIKKTHHQMPRWVIIIISLSILAFIAYHASSLLIMLIFSGLLAYLMSSVINRLESFGLRRRIIAILLFIFLGITVYGAEIILSPYLQREIRNFYTNLPDISKKIENVITGANEDNIKNFTVRQESIRNILNEFISPGRLLSKILNFPGIFNQAASFLLGMVLIPFFTFFLLKDWPSILKTVMGWVPPAYVETTVSLFSEINILAGNYLRGLAIDCISVGIVASFGLWILGINYPISLGILTGAANVIPYLGPITACVAASFIAFIQFNSISAAINVVLLYIAIKLTDDLVIQPLTIGKSVRLHPMLLIISIFIGEKLFGIIGMVLAVPIVTTAQKILTILIENKRRTSSVKLETISGKQVFSDYPGTIPL